MSTGRTVCHVFQGIPWHQIVVGHFSRYYLSSSAGLRPNVIRMDTLSRRLDKNKQRLIVTRLITSRVSAFPKFSFPNNAHGSNNLFRFIGLLIGAGKHGITSYHLETTIVDRKTQTLTAVNRMLSFASMVHLVERTKSTPSTTDSHSTTTENSLHVAVISRAGLWRILARTVEKFGVDRFPAHAETSWRLLRTTIDELKAQQQFLHLLTCT